MTSASCVFQASSLTTDSILRRQGAGITGFQAGYAAGIPASVAEMLPVKLGLLRGGLKSSERVKGSSWSLLSSFSWQASRNKDRVKFTATSLAFA